MNNMTYGNKHSLLSGAVLIICLVVFSGTGLWAQSGELQLNKDVSHSIAYKDDTLTYDIVVINPLSDNDWHIEVVDVMPMGVSYLPGTADVEPQAGTNYRSLLWRLEGKAGESEVGVSFKAVVDTDYDIPTAIYNIVYIPGGATKRDSAETIIMPDSTTRLELDKTVDSAEAVPLSILTYKINITNIGNETKYDIEIVDPVSDLVSFVPYSATENGVYDGNEKEVYWKLDSLEADETVELSFKVMIKDTAEDQDIITNQASITTPIETSSNRVETVVIVPTDVDDLILTKQVDLTTAYRGDTINYSLTLSNPESAPVGGVIIHDTLPSYLTYISATADGIVEYITGENLLVWDIGFMPGFTSRQMDIVAVINRTTGTGTEIINRADVVAPDIVLGNQVVTTVIDLPDINFDLSKTVYPVIAAAGDTVTYTIYADNLSVISLEDAELIDLLPSELTFVDGSVTVNGTTTTTTYTIDELTIPLGEIYPGTDVTINYRAIINEGVSLNQALTNSATLIGTDRDSRDWSFGPVTASLNVDLPRLLISKTVNAASATAGDFLDYTITVKNISQVIADDVILFDQMPQGFIYINGSTQINGSPADDPTGNNPYEWHLGDLQPDQRIVLIYKVQIGFDAAGGRNTNTVWSNHDDPNTDTEAVSATIHVIAGLIPGSIRGQVIIDCDNDGLADDGQIPTGINIFLDDGSRSRSNQAGMFYFNTVRAGQRMVTLDERDLRDYVLPEGVSPAAFVYVDEDSEAYVKFRVCPRKPHLTVTKQAALIPKVKVIKTAELNRELLTDSTGVTVDYHISIKSNGGVDPTTIKVVDSFPSETRLILGDNQELKPQQAGNILTYSFTVDQNRFDRSVYYSLEDLAPGLRKSLSNYIHLEGGQEIVAVSRTPIKSATAEVKVGPFKRIPAQDIAFNLIGAYFESGKALLLTEATPILSALADSLRKYDGAAMRAEGHADYRPIHTAEFPSNWELSTARAKAVVTWLTEIGIEAGRMTYEGFAATRPVDNRRTPEALAKNRRVEIFIEGRTQSRVDLSGLKSDRWENSASLELSPINWDTLLTLGDNSFEPGLNDEWEVRITFENNGPVPAHDVRITEIIPDGTELVPGSLFINDIETAPLSAKPLTFNLGNMEISGKIEVRYRIKAVSADYPVGSCLTEIKMSGNRDEIVIQTAGELYVK